MFLISSLDSEKSYQEGAIFPFPVPSFDIEQYLSQANFSHSFEIDSDYSSESIKANFDRILAKERYKIDRESYRAYVSVKTVPYREGSKSLFNFKIRTKLNNGKTINLVNIINELEAEMVLIVND